MPNYRDDFYTRNNIIGYTGALADNPTVYFRNGNEFGRITQAHGNPNNVGRNVTRIAADYKIENSGPNENAQEFYNGEIKHSSRNPFIEVTDKNRDILAHSIDTFTDIKPKYN